VDKPVNPTTRRFVSGSDDVASRTADVFLRQSDPHHLGWKASGTTRHRQWLLWTWKESEETRLVYSQVKGWWIKHRWVTIKSLESDRTSAKANSAAEQNESALNLKIGAGKLAV
jgi:hypothetical protein